MTTMDMAEINEICNRQSRKIAELEKINVELLAALKGAVVEICTYCPGKNRGENYTCKLKDKPCFVQSWLEIIKKAEDKK